jgi:cytosine permease
MKRFIEKINHFTKDYAHEVVPIDQRRHAWRIFAIWSVSVVCLPVMMIGFVLGQSMSFPQMVGVIILGQFLLAAITSVSAYIGGKLHYPSSVLLQVTFGKHGVKFISICIALAVLGWYGFQLEVFTIALKGIAYKEFGLDLPSLPIIICFGLLMSLTSVIGFKGLDFISRLSVPILIIVLAFPLIRAWPDIDWNAVISFVPENPMRFGAGISMILGSVSLGMLISPDYARYSRNEVHAVSGVFLATFISASLFIFYAALVMLATGKTDFVEIMYHYGMGWPALLAIILTTWTTNDTNNYIGGIALTSVFPKAKKWMLSLICAMFGTIFAIIGVADNFVPWLMLLGIVFSPAAGAYITDYFIYKSAYKNLANLDVPNMRLESKISWLSGVLLGWFTMPKENLGAGLFELTSVPALDGLICAIIVHLALAKFLHAKNPRFVEV